MAKGSGSTRTSSPKASFSQITGLKSSTDKKAITSSLSILAGMDGNTKLHTGFTVREVRKELNKQLKKL